MVKYQQENSDKEKMASMKNREKTECEKLWAEEKYLVLSKSQNIYKQIREYLKVEPKLENLKEMIEAAKRLPENRTEGINAFQHIWGYFKKEAEPEEKIRFLELIADYQKENIEQEAIIRYIQELLLKYPNSYLQNSSIIKEMKNKENR